MDAATKQEKPAETGAPPGDAEPLPEINYFNLVWCALAVVVMVVAIAGATGLVLTRAKPDAVLRDLAAEAWMKQWIADEKARTGWICRS